MGNVWWIPERNEQRGFSGHQYWPIKSPSPPEGTSQLKALSLSQLFVTILHQSSISPCRKDFTSLLLHPVTTPAAGSEAGFTVKEIENWDVEVLPWTGDAKGLVSSFHRHPLKADESETCSEITNYSTLCGIKRSVWRKCQNNNVKVAQAGTEWLTGWQSIRLCLHCYHDWKKKKKAVLMRAGDSLKKDILWKSISCGYN